jgi:fused signal recognition particle receptor
MIRLFGKRKEAKPDAAELSRWRKGLNRTRAAFSNLMQLAATGRTEVDDEYYAELHDALVLSDVGLTEADNIIKDLKRAAKDHGAVRIDAVRALLEQLLTAMLTATEPMPMTAEGKLSVVLFAGVNGVGKTTMLAKIAKLLQAEGVTCVAAAADTFRAAAVEQLGIWGKRIGFPVITGAEGADPASVVFNAVEHALAQGKNAVLIDTAGRMQTKKALMDELSKVGRAARKVAEKRGVDAASALHEVNFLVLDATTGQNAIWQAQLFAEAVPLHGLILNKIDGTAKGGVIFPVVKAAKVPVVFLGVGEQADDVVEFDASEFVREMLEPEG